MNRSHFLAEIKLNYHNTSYEGEFFIPKISEIKLRLGDLWSARWLLNQAKNEITKKNPNISKLEFLLDQLLETFNQVSLTEKENYQIAELHNKLALIFSNTQLEKQLFHWNMSLFWWPDYLEGLIGKGDTLGRLSNYKEGSLLILHAVELYPENVKSWVSACNYYRHIDPQWELAEPFCRKALAMDPDNLDAVSALTVVLLRRGNCQEAVKYGEVWIKLDQQNYWGWTNLGDAYWCLDELEQARLAYRQFIDLAPIEIQQQYRNASNNLAKKNNK